MCVKQAFMGCAKDVLVNWGDIIYLSHEEFTQANMQAVIKFAAKKFFFDKISLRKYLYTKI